MMRRRLLVAVIVALPAFGACDEKLSDLTGPTPDLQPTFTSIQRDIFQSTDLAGRVACVSCHTDQGRPQGPAATMNLREGFAYNALVNVPSWVNGKRGAIRVIPGDPENSYLIHKLEGRTSGPTSIVGERMPRLTPPYLTNGQILVIKRWIELGAPNN